MSINKKMRFDVFKRDGFKCQYCGKSSPQIVLEIDHIVPINEGGGDNLENLITSCFDCNRGKGKELLENYKEGTDPTEQAILLLERERQLREYNEVIKIVRKRKEKDIHEILKYWEKCISTPGRSPISIIRKALDYLPEEKILEAIDICHDSHKKQEDKTWADSYVSFFYGILRKLTNNFGAGDCS